MKKIQLLLAFVLIGLGSAPVRADNDWGGYHWRRSGTELTLNVADNVSSAWDSYLDEAIADWSQSSVIELTEIAGTNKPKSCRPTLGRIEVCSSKYGNNGWLGIAQIWTSGGGGDGHIVQATTRVNDFYFSQRAYNTPAWRRLVMCQELAHDFGLDHQDEIQNNANLGSCMDYTDDPDGGAGGAVNTDPSNEHPNAHDYEQLETIYAHAESPAVSSSPGNSSNNDQDNWGALKRTNGNTSVYQNDLGAGKKIITFVFWAGEPR